MQVFEGEPWEKGQRKESQIVKENADRLPATQTFLVYIGEYRSRCAEEDGGEVEEQCLIFCKDQ